jgi:hypothetical protein
MVYYCFHNVVYSCSYGRLVLVCKNDVVNQVLLLVTIGRAGAFRVHP